MIPRRRMILASALVILAVSVGGACGDDGRDRETQSGAERGLGDQPAPRTTTFEQGLFDNIPRYQPSDPLGPRTEKNDVVAQSFQARDVTPEAILAFYERRLEPAWGPLEPPHPTGPGTWRGEWARDQWRLTVSVTRAPALEEATGPDAAQGTRHSQYSLSLAPR